MTAQRDIRWKYQLSGTCACPRTVTVRFWTCKHDALRSAGVDERHLFEDRVVQDDLQQGNAVVVRRRGRADRQHRRSARARKRAGDS